MTKETGLVAPFREALSPLQWALLGVVVVLFVALATTVALATPPWEANDEPDHVTNVKTIASGSLYRPEPGVGIEAHQPPLYYALLAGYQTVLGLEHEMSELIWHSPPQPSWFYLHDTENEAADQRYVSLLRLPSVLFGVATVLITAVIAWVLGAGRWTILVAAAIVAFVPKFVFVSGVINNDNLATLVGAGGTLVAVLLVGRDHEPRRKAWLAAGLGALLGVMTITKLTGLTLIPAFVFAIYLSATNRRQLGQYLLYFGGAWAAIGGWWVIRNITDYGDPLLFETTRQYLAANDPLLVVSDFSVDRIFNRLPRGAWRSTWYTSGWNQFFWSWRAYIPYWLLTGVGIAGVAIGVRRLDSAQRRVVGVLALAVLGAAATFWMLGVTTNQLQARVVFFALPALAVLVALGYELLRLPIVVRFLLPIAGLAGTLFAINRDILQVVV